MPKRPIARLQIHTIRQESNHGRALYYAFVSVEWKDGGVDNRAFPIDVPVGPLEAQASHDCHERVVAMAISGALFITFPT